MDISGFVRNASSPNGIGTYCKGCQSELAREYRRLHPKPKMPKGPKPRFSEPYEVRHKERLRARSKDYYARVRKPKLPENRERLNEAARLARAKNPEKARAACRAWEKLNSHKKAESRARRRALQHEATPAWADRSKMTDIYKQSRSISEQTGIPHEVDHIYPLRSRVVCGLHIETNLRIIPANENRIKSNKMPENANDNEIAVTPESINEHAVCSVASNRIQI